MSLKGGYQIIDLKFKPFDSREGTSHTFPELFNDLKNSNAKMIIISGLNMDGVKYNDYDVIFYEVEENSEPMYYQAVLRRIWTPIDYTCTTKYISIYNDDKVKITQDTFIYEILPDDTMSETSENALQNKVITQAFTEDRNRLTALENLQPTYLTLDGSRPMTGTLNLNGQKIIGVAVPTENYNAANKKYVDTSLTEYLKLDGSSIMTGDLKMNSHKITGVKAPSENTDAANKKYVNDRVDYGISRAKTDKVYESFYEKRAEYRINITMPMDFSNMSIEIVPSKAIFTLDNSVSFTYVGLSQELEERFYSNADYTHYFSFCGSFRFPVNSIGEDMNIFGTVESDTMDTITIKFYGDLKDIGSINTPIFCTVPLVPVKTYTGP